MTVARTIVLIGTALTVAACSNTHAAKPRATPKPATTRPSTKAASAFCLDLTAFQVGVVVFRGDVVDMVRGKRPDLKDLRRRAALIGVTGTEMRASAPPDIAEQFRVALKAIKTSASHMKAGATVGDVVRPVFNDRVNPAFDALDKYRCH